MAVCVWYVRVGVSLFASAYEWFVYVCISVNLCVYVCECVHMWECESMSLCMCVSLCQCMCVRERERKFVRVYDCIIKVHIVVFMF